MRLRLGRIVEVAAVSCSPTCSGGAQNCRVELDCGRASKAVAYPRLLPRPVRPGDTVWVNTTAVDLGLGTGGVDFVAALCPDNDVPAETRELRRSQGHVMKLKYTPLQHSVLSVEAQESPFHEVMTRAADTVGMAAICAELHSQGVLAVRIVQALGAQRGRRLRVAYIMPEGGALPAAFSRQLTKLRTAGELEGVITCGEAFGGDYEAVTLHSGLLAARHVLGADICVVAIGPGVVGTGTAFGTTALTQGQALNAALDLHSPAVAVPRISFADSRARHSGLSHHTVTILSRLVHRPVVVGVPALPNRQRRRLARQLHRTGVTRRHRVEVYDTCSPSFPSTRRLAEAAPRITTMGRTYDEDPAFFEAVAASCRAAVTRTERWRKRRDMFEQL
jgi:hypothetical protein